MCEFKVHLRAAGKEEMVAEDIVLARIQDGSLLLKDVLGSSKNLDEVIIREVDVNREFMGLVKVPIIADLLRFLEAYEACQSKKQYEERVELSWEEVKAKGDEMIRSLWRKYGGDVST